MLINVQVSGGRIMAAAGQCVLTSESGRVAGGAVEFLLQIRCPASLTNPRLARLCLSVPRLRDRSRQGKPRRACTRAQWTC